MTEPWPNGALHSDAIDPLDNPVVQRDSARDLACILAERNDRALDLHRMEMTAIGPFYTTCQTSFPCLTRRCLTGADDDREDAA
jgi:hypothetical protein